MSTYMNTEQKLTLPGIDPVRRITIHRDNDPEDPRAWDNLGTMVCWHRRYRLGDEQPSEDPQDYLLGLAEQVKPGIEERLNAESEKMARNASRYLYNSAEWKQAIREIDNYVNARVEATLDKHYIILELYLYDHSGITMRTSAFSDPWDSGKVGFIYVSREKVLKEYSWKVLTAKRRKQIAEYLDAEVRTYDQYLTGDVYGFTVEEHNNETGEWEEIDSCWGFYGEDVDSVHDHTAHLGFTKEQIKTAFADVGEPVTQE